MAAHLALLRIPLFRLVVFLARDDSEPTEYSHDVGMYRQTRFTLRSVDWPGLMTFTLAIKVNGAIFQKNSYLNTTVIVSFSQFPSFDKLSLKSSWC